MYERYQSLEIDLIFKKCLSPVDKMSKSGDTIEILWNLVRSYTGLLYKNSKPEIKKYRKELRLMNYGEKEWIRKRN